MQVAAMAQIIIIYVDCELLRIRVDLKLLLGPDCLTLSALAGKGKRALSCHSLPVQVRKLSPGKKKNLF